jgi:broad specificity phosphatase PhoE
LTKPLTELGQQQAAALAAWMPGAVPNVDAIYSSTMQRARETVAPLAAAYGLPVNFDERLREVGTSRLDHTPWPSESLLCLRRLLGQRTAVCPGHARPA